MAAVLTSDINLYLKATTHMQSSTWLQRLNCVIADGTKGDLFSFSNWTISLMGFGYLFCHESQILFHHVNQLLEQRVPILCPQKLVRSDFHYWIYRLLGFHRLTEPYWERTWQFFKFVFFLLWYNILNIRFCTFFYAVWKLVKENISWEQITGKTFMYILTISWVW